MNTEPRSCSIAWARHCERRPCEHAHTRRTKQRPRSRALALDSAVRAVRRGLDDRARRDRRQRRLALDPRRTALLHLQPRLGRQRLPDRLRRAAAAGRALRRPAGAQPHLPAGRGPVHAGLLDVRPGMDTDAAGLRPLRAGHRRRDDLGRRPGHDRHDVSQSTRAGEGDRRVRLRGLCRRVCRASWPAACSRKRSTGIGSSS